MTRSIALSHFRRLSTATVSKLLPNSHGNLRKTTDPDEAIKIYTALTAGKQPSTTTLYAQGYTVSCLAKSRRFSDIEQFLESHKSQNLITDESFLSSLIRSYGMVGMFENALKTYNQMEELGTPRSALSFNSLLTACRRCNMLDRVPGYFNEFPLKFGFLPDELSYSLLIKSYCEMGSLDVAMETLSEIEEKGVEVKADVFTPILQSLFENGRRDEAERFWDEMVMKKGLKPDVVSYNVKLLHTPEPENVNGIVKEMSNAGVVQNMVSYNCLITCYCENGMIDEAKTVYDWISEEKGCNPNIATYRTLVVYLCKQEQFLEAFRFFKLSVYNHKLLDFDILKCLADGLMKNGYEREAKSMTRILKRKSTGFLNYLEGF